MDKYQFLSLMWILAPFTFFALLLIVSIASKFHADKHKTDKEEYEVAMSVASGTGLVAVGFFALFIIAFFIQIPDIIYGEKYPTTYLYEGKDGNIYAEEWPVW